MIDRKSTGRITQDRKVFKRPRSEGDPQAVQDMQQTVPETELQTPESDDRTEHHKKIAAALKTLDLPDYHITEITAVDMFEVDGQTVIQLKNGDFVKIAMIAPDEEKSSEDTSSSRH